MMQKLTKIWQSMNASYWFYPSVFSLFAVGMAVVSIWIDRNGMAPALNDIAWLQPARPSGASDMLTVIAGAMIGVASTVFSITIAAVAYASGNYGPRLLTNFMEDKGNQLSLATFIGTFVYAVTVLRVVRTESEGGALTTQQALPGFVPQLSLLIAYILMAISVMVLVYFLNHVPASIRINTVLQGIGQRLLTYIRANFDQPARQRATMEPVGGRAVTALGTGYVQIVNFERLERIAQKVGGYLQLAVRTGDFVHPCIALAYWREDDALEDLRDTEIRACFELGGMRTTTQDPHFLIDELVEIGLRALSPGINDPFTAISALHWLGAATAELGRRDLRRTFVETQGENARERLQLLADDYAHYVRRGFGSIRSGVATSPNAAVVMFTTLRHAASTLDDEVRHKVLVNEGRQLIRQARIDLAGPNLEQVEARYQQFRKEMEG